MSSGPSAPSGEPLSQRELEILHLIDDGLSNRKIAEQLSLSVDTIKWYNKELYGKLGVSSRTQALKVAREQQLLARPTTLQETVPSSVAQSLPAPLTSYIGRAEEGATLRQLLTTSRLVVLTGPGGVGKTRLALHVAATMADSFRHGVALVDLAPVREAASVADAILLALQGRTGDDESSVATLQRSLSRRHLLLLLDNFEHVLDAGPLLTTLLAAAPDLTVLVTSRERLRLYGEVEFPVRPLPIPAVRPQQDWQMLLANDAVALFIQRARAAQPDLELTPANMTAAADICTRLDGLVLALELAAPLAKLFPLPYLAQRLEQSPVALPEGPRDLPARQRTLQATIEWSVDLLQADTRRLFTQLAVFRGGATLDSMQAVCLPRRAGDILNGVATLVDKNLIFVHETPHGEPRFLMLETIRQFAYALLQRSSEATDLHLRHAIHYAVLAERYSREVYTARSVVWNARLQSEKGNLDAALAWALVQEDPSVGLRLVAALGEHLYIQGTAEDKRWVEVAVEKAQTAPPELAAAVYRAAGMLQHGLGNMAHVKTLTRQAADLFESVGDERQAAWALNLLCIANSEDPAAIPECIDMAERNVVLFRRCGDKPGLSRALSSLGELRRMQGDYAAAKIAYAEGLALVQETGERARQAIHYANLGTVAYIEGQHRLAIAYLQESISIWAELSIFVSAEFYILAGAVAAVGQPLAAAKLIGAADALLDDAGIELQPPDQKESQAIKAAVRHSLSESSYASAWQSGAAMETLEGLDFALSLACG